MEMIRHKNVSSHSPGLSATPDFPQSSMVLLGGKSWSPGSRTHGQKDDRGAIRGDPYAVRWFLAPKHIRNPGSAGACHATPSFARNCDTKFRAVVPRGTVQPGRLTSGTGSPIQCHALQNSLCGWPLIAWPGWGQRPLTSLSNLAFP